ESGDAENVVVSVADRFLDTARQFAENWHATKFYDSYSDLADDPDVDVVYVAVINSLHLSVGRQMLAAGKHVLMEKPLALNPNQAEQLFAEARASNLFLMEALWSRFIPTFKEVRTRLDKLELGDVTHAHASFGLKLDHMPRLTQKDLGGGCVIDSGVYAVNFMLWVFGEEKPLEIKTTGKLNDQGIEAEATVLLKFSNNRFGTFMLSTSCNLPNEAFVTGTKGTIKLQAPFWCTSNITSPSGEFTCQDKPPDRPYAFKNNQFLKYEALHVASCLKQGLTESPVMPHSATLLIAEVVQDIRRQLGTEPY
ncbi:Oxidoreductase N-terminal, partial [Trinorchestia longiramus]